MKVEIKIHFYSREKSLFIVCACFRNDVNRRVNMTDSQILESMLCRVNWLVLRKQLFLT